MSEQKYWIREMRERKYWILDEQDEPKAVDFTTWANWMELTHQQRVLAQTKLPGEVLVSTVFLGLDHNFSSAGPPLLWETMIFGGPHDQYQDRYHTREEALDGHAKALAVAKGKLKRIKKLLARRGDTGMRHNSGHWFTHLLIDLIREWFRARRTN